MAKKQFTPSTIPESLMKAQSLIYAAIALATEASDKTMEQVLLTVIEKLDEVEAEFSVNKMGAAA